MHIKGVKNKAGKMAGLPGQNTEKYIGFTALLAERNTSWIDSMGRDRRPETEDRSGFSFFRLRTKYI